MIFKIFRYEEEGKRNMTRKKIIENLKDCDCSEEEIADFMKALDEDCECRALDLLEHHREALLEQFHKSGACINCLDYLVFQIKKKNYELK